MVFYVLRKICFPWCGILLLSLFIVFFFFFTNLPVVNIFMGACCWAFPFWVRISPVYIGVISADLTFLCASMLIKCVCGYLCWMGCFNLSLRSYEMGGPIKLQQKDKMPLDALSKYILRHANSARVAIATRLIHNIIAPSGWLRMFLLWCTGHLMYVCCDWR